MEVSTQSLMIDDGLEEVMNVKVLPYNSEETVLLIKVPISTNVKVYQTKSNNSYFLVDTFIENTLYKEHPSYFINMNKHETFMAIRDFIIEFCFLLYI